LVNPPVINVAVPAAVLIAENDNETNGELEKSDDLDNLAQNSPEEEDGDLMEIKFDVFAVKVQQ
jgi:hypothetical protein